MSDHILLAHSNQRQISKYRVELKERVDRIYGVKAGGIPRLRI
jgi:hypothetical protein